MKLLFVILLFPATALCQDIEWEYLEVAPKMGGWSIFKGTVTVSMAQTSFSINSNTPSLEGPRFISLREIKGSIGNNRKRGDGIEAEVKATITELASEFDPYACNGTYYKDDFGAPWGTEEAIDLF